jgi:hypothetical protein
MCEPRFLDHQLYLNGLRVIEGVNEDYVVADSRLPAFTFLVKGDDRIVWTEGHGVGVNEFELEPKKVHRLCPKCQENSKPQPDTTGCYTQGFNRELCVPCAIELIAAEIQDEKERLEERLADLTRYQSFQELAIQHQGSKGILADLMKFFDVYTKSGELKHSTAELVKRTRARIKALQDAHDSLVEDGDC